MVDAKGLITDERAALSDVVRPFARTTGDSGDVDREELLEVVRRVCISPGLGLGFRVLYPGPAAWIQH